MIPVALGGEIVSTFGRPELVKLGECKVIEEVMIGEDKVSASFSHKCGILSSTDVYMPVYNKQFHLGSTQIWNKLKPKEPMMLYSWKAVYNAFHLLPLHIFYASSEGT